MTSTLSKGQGAGGVSSEQVREALGALGVKALEGSAPGARAELLGQLLAVVDEALEDEQGDVAVEATRLGYFEVLYGRVQAAGYAEELVDAALQEEWVRGVARRVRRVAYDWRFLGQRLPDEGGQLHVAAAVDSLLSAVMELFEPFYPRPAESLLRHLGRFQRAVRAASAQVAVTQRHFGAFRRFLRVKGFRD